MVGLKYLCKKEAWFFMAITHFVTY